MCLLAAEANLHQALMGNYWNLFSNMQDKLQHRLSHEILSFFENGFADFGGKVSGTRPRECQDRIPRKKLCRIDKLSAQTAVWDAISWPKLF